MPLSRRTPLKRKTALRPRSVLKSQQRRAVKVKKRAPSKLEDKSLQELDRKAWEWFSRYVRLRDSDWQGDGWYGKCISCSYNGMVVRPDGRYVAGWDAGHYVTRGNKVVKYDERNVNLQCKFHCNKMLSGNRDKQYPALQAKYGDEVPDELDTLARDTKYYKFSRDELREVVSDSRTYIDFTLKNC
jgi:hypothetical protein